MNIEQIIKETQEELNKAGGNWKPAKLFPAWERETCLQDGERKINFSPDRNDKKVLVSGVLPKYNNRFVEIDKERAVIGVSVSRGAEAIASAIQKRLLPVYEPQIVKVKKEVERLMVYDGKMNEIKQKIGEALETDSRYNNEFYKNVKEIYLHIRVDSPSSVRFEFNCDAEKAQKIVDFIKHSL